MPSPLTLDERLEAARADELAHELKRHEPLAVQAETYPDINTRLYFARRFQEVTGVVPSQREVFKAELAAIRNGSGRTVAELRRLFQSSPPADSMA